jgi:uncharacterized protein (TIGR03066 family)
MRLLLSAAVSVFALSLAAAEDKKDEKIDPAKLVGRWEPKEKKGPTLEFKKDGKVAFAMSQDGKELKADGTYKVEGNKVSVALSFEGVEQKMERTITKLTADELVTKDEKGMERTFVRIKADEKK